MGEPPGDDRSTYRTFASSSLSESWRLARMASSSRPAEWRHPVHPLQKRENNGLAPSAWYHGAISRQSLEPRVARALHRSLSPPASLTMTIERRMHGINRTINHCCFVHAAMGSPAVALDDSTKSLFASYREGSGPSTNTCEAVQRSRSEKLVRAERPSFAQRQRVTHLALVTEENAFYFVSRLDQTRIT